MKLLVICGPTATGKTKLATYLAKKFNGEIISADSRQIYKNMDIGTGKDLSTDAKIKFDPDVKINKDEIGYYLIRGVRVWGYDLVEPLINFSVNSYVKIISKVLEDIIKRDKLPIIVGGTGFYIKALIDGFSTLYVPKNEKLRKSLSIEKTDELFEHLAQMDSIKAASLNASDKKNPRRLIRAIEVAQWNLEKKVKKVPKVNLMKASILFIGLKSNRPNLFTKIEMRVKERLSMGFKEEAQELLKNKSLWNKQSMQSLGYSQWKDYILGKKTELEVINTWTTGEKKYAKRQLTWFNKDGRINWFDISSETYEKEVVKLVSKWHNEN